MASGDQRHGKQPAAVADDKFPEGLRVLAVDDDRVCLRVLEGLLNILKYNPTTVTDARTALKMLREGGEDQFDLVITDVHMPYMDGFELLELIGLEMDLPVIMLSVDGEMETIYKGIEHGACDYIVKPVNVKKLKNIWKHVVRKNHVSVNHSSSSNSAEGGLGGTQSKKRSKRKRNGGDGSDENKESTSVRTTWKKPRVSWNGELHNRFLEVVYRIGINRTVPKKILRMMNVHNLSRECVASHLQKYRMYLKRVTNDPMNPNPLGDSSARPNCYMELGYQETLPPLALCSCGLHNLNVAPQSILGPHSLSIQPRNLATGTFSNNGGSSMPWLPHSGSHHPSGPSVGGSFADHPMHDVVRPVHSEKSYVLREKLLEASSMVPSSHPGSDSSSFAEIPNGGLSAPPSAWATAQFSYLAGSSSNSSQNVAPSGFPGPMVGAPLIPSSQGQTSQLARFGASPGQMAMFHNEQQNQMAGISINNTTSVGIFSEQVTPLFNMASNTAPVEMINDNLSPVTQIMVNGGSTSSPLRNLQLGSPVAPPAHMVNGGEDASGIPPMQADQQAPDEDQPTYSTNAFLEDIYNSMVNHDFNEDDDAFFGGEY